MTEYVRVPVTEEMRVAGLLAFHALGDRMRVEGCDIVDAVITAALAAAPAEDDGSCDWAEDEDGAWETDCGGVWEFFYDGPTENGVKFCHRCGKPVQVTPFSEDDPNLVRVKDQSADNPSISDS